jgi:tRNA(Ser,Leu) C12 N-acetylase TAN1
MIKTQYEIMSRYRVALEVTQPYSRRMLKIQPGRSVITIETEPAYKEDLALMDLRQLKDIGRSLGAHLSRMKNRDSIVNEILKTIEEKKLAGQGN